MGREVTAISTAGQLERRQSQHNEQTQNHEIISQISLEDIRNLIPAPVSADREMVGSIVIEGMSQLPRERRSTESGHCSQLNRGELLSMVESLLDNPAANKDRLTELLRSFLSLETNDSPPQRSQERMQVWEDRTTRQDLLPRGMRAIAENLFELDTGHLLIRTTNSEILRGPSGDVIQIHRDGAFDVHSRSGPIRVMSSPPHQTILFADGSKITFGPGGICMVSNDRASVRVDPRFDGSNQREVQHPAQAPAPSGPWQQRIDSSPPRGHSTPPSDARSVIIRPNHVQTPPSNGARFGAAVVNPNRPGVRGGEIVVTPNQPGVRGGEIVTPNQPGIRGGEMVPWIQPGIQGTGPSVSELTPPQPNTQIRRRQ